MKKSNSRLYGHAHCIGCKADIDLSSQPSSIPVYVGNEVLLLCYCNRCYLTLCDGHNGTIQRAIDDAEKKLSAVDIRAEGYAVLSKVALLEHDFDPVKAYEQGSSLPLSLHLAITQGRANLTKIGGVIIVASEEKIS